MDADISGGTQDNRDGTYRPKELDTDNMGIDFRMKN